MSRKKSNYTKKLPSLEIKYKNPLLSKFIRKLMRDGKLRLAEKIVYKALDQTEQSTKKPGIEIFLAALDKVRPLIKVKARRVGGSTYQVPVEVSPERGFSLAMVWIIGICRNKAGVPMFKKLANELIQASDGVGAAFKKKEETHKMAEANKAFSHYKT